MDKLRFYSVSDQYINYLRSDPRLYNVIDNKEGRRSHTRKYLGIVLRQGEFNYFVPVSSPKKTDYYVRPDGTRAIRRSIIPIIRMTSQETLSREPELKGTLKLSNMIPVPDSELVPYSFADEQDYNYKRIMLKEYDFVVKNHSLIVKSASVLYNQKKTEDRLSSGTVAPEYLKQVVDFLYAEKKCLEFMRAKSLPENQTTSKPSVKERISQIRQAQQKADKIYERHDTKSR